MNIEEKEDLINKLKKHFKDASFEIIKYAGGGEDFRIDDFLFDIDEYGSDWGVSKLVVSFEDIPNYVIKIPFQGKSYDVDDYDYENEEYYDEDVIDFMYADIDCPFTNLNSWDYCETESNYYIKASEANIEDMFAGTYYICDINNYPIYASEKVEKILCDVIHSREYNVDDKSYQQATTLMGDKVNHDLTVIIAMYIKSYGLEKTKKFLKFINDNAISDRHYGNFGLSSDGKIKFIDYSSWND